MKRKINTMFIKYMAYDIKICYVSYSDKEKIKCENIDIKYLCFKYKSSTFIAPKDRQHEYKSIICKWHAMTKLIFLISEINISG
jgi:hypothetical protein